MNSQTKMTLEMTLGEINMSGEFSWATPDELREFWKDWADAFLNCEEDHSTEGELFPDWCALIVTQAIEKDIDWSLVWQKAKEEFEIGE